LKANTFSIITIRTTTQAECPKISSCSLNNAGANEEIIVVVVRILSAGSSSCVYIF